MDVIILSAGCGKRFGDRLPKTFISLYGKPLIYYSICAFNKSSLVDNIYLVINNAYFSLIERYKKKYFNKLSKFKEIIIGGEERKNSVFNALNYINSKGGFDYIAIHDGARPFVKGEIINNVYCDAKEHGAAAPGVDLIDTIKLKDDDNFILSHPKREKFTAIQTPQIFKFQFIYNAYKNLILNNDFTDDTEIYSAYYENKVKISIGDNDLFKITYKEDLIKAKTIYKRTKKEWI